MANLFRGLSLVALAVGVALANPTNVQKSSNPKVSSLFSRVFSLPNQSGNYYDVTDYVPDLFGTPINDDIESVYQTGMWMYYENNNYNSGAGSVYFVHGIDISVNFPNDYCNMASSLRFAGNQQIPNADTWTLFEGQYFTANEFYGVTDASYLEYLDMEASSVIITGLSPWTFYSGQSWTGDAICVYPDTDHDVGPQGDQLDFGLYPDIRTTGIPDNAVRSVRKGCWSEKVAPSVQMNYDGKAENGAWGHFNL